jgi:hypothetical protein
MPSESEAKPNRGDSDDNQDHNSCGTELIGENAEHLPDGTHVMTLAPRVCRQRAPAPPLSHTPGAYNKHAEKLIAAHETVSVGIGIEQLKSRRREHITDQSVVFIKE